MEATADNKVVGARKPTRLKEAEHSRNIWLLSVPSDITLDNLLQPDFWAHVGAQLRPCARIEVVPEDMSWFAELIVLDCGRLWAKVAPLRFVELAGKADVPTPSAADAYKVEFKGPIKKHVVIRQSDKVIVQEGIAQKEDAHRWIADHINTLAR